MTPDELISYLPPSVQIIVVILGMLFGGSVGYRKGKVHMINASNDEKRATAESVELDDNAAMAAKLRSHEIRLRELEACMFGIAVHFSNLVLCEPCRQTNHQLLSKISDMVASEADTHTCEVESA